MMFVDIEGNRLNSLVNTVAHEGMHLKGAGETNATATGYLTDLTYRVNAWANSGQISEHRATAPVGILNPAAHQQLLGGNNDLFNSLDSRDGLEFRFLPQSERDLANQLAAQSGGQLTPEAIMNTMRNSKTMEVEPNGFYGAVVDITQASPEALAALDPSNGSIFVTTDAEGNAKYLIQNMSEIPINEAAKSLLEEYGYSFYEQAERPYEPPKLIFPDSIAMAAGLNYNLNSGETRSEQQLARDREKFTMGMAQTAALPVSGTYALAKVGVKGTLGLIGLGAGFDAAGQVYQGEEYRPGQTIRAAQTALTLGPLANASVLNNTVLGGVAGGATTGMNNFYYNDNKDVFLGVLIGGGAGGFGTSVGGRIPNEYIGGFVETIIQNSPSFFSMPDKNKVLDGSK